MSSSIEERLREYAKSLDEAVAVRAGTVPTPSNAAIAALSDRRARPAVKRRFLVGVTVLSVIVATAAIVIGHDRRSAPSPTTRATIPANGDGLRALFTRTTPQGIVIVARAGLVPIAATAGCPFVPVPKTQPADPGCTNATAPGVQVDYTFDHHTYRATALYPDTAAAHGPYHLAPAITLAQIREVRADGVSVLGSGSPTPYLAVLFATGLATVRVNPSRTAATGLDEMTPVDGWVAFVARNFDNTVEGLDAAGHVVKTALPWRCC